VVAIGVSTGGPAALVEILRALPPELKVPLILVIHINEPFGAGFAEWLGQATQRTILYPRDRSPVGESRGTVIMAPPGKHLVVNALRFQFSHEAERHSCRPSVDVLFESLAREYGPRAVGCLLTGMGRDGAAGLLAMRQAGAATFAQDEATSVVYGMPREAALLGAVEQVLPLTKIGPALAPFLRPDLGSF
jgi:two-component system chemotaxis response regulator CheB